ncbi:sulfatase-like hydrolase/transferase [Polaribacter sp. SA4-12]|uniref:sulfatase-like hydrolase/transferase n=1 Tax=Polaribacter sp. SA4-12 TaxID=1312072 RepID=UPI000B3CFE66|nr:sulfatase-like hydrolase/transferase [Polaribacter sp. SA4-12]ARV16525.1 sulfatase [Polaribacter sp. SA4-12]
MNITKHYLTFILVLLSLNYSYGQKIKEQKKQNVVLILIDDLSHLGVTSYGANRLSSSRGLFENVEFETPVIDKLATEGILFNNAHAYPLCENSRIALMSGKYNSRNYLRPKSQHKSDITIGDIFKKAGYATGIYGKWKQTRGTKEIPGAKYIYEFGWDEFTCFDVTTEGQRFINPHLVVDGKTVNYTGRTDLDPETGRRWYGPDICNRDALKFIDKNKDKPFLLYYPMLLVHDDHKPTPDTKPNSLFDNFDEANHNRNGHSGDDQKYLPDMIAYTDKLIGNVIKKLEEHNLTENTIIVVMGDNGTKEAFAHIWPNGEVYPARKGGTSDNGTHVPLIISNPNKINNETKKPLKYNGLVDIVDILPTLTAATDISIQRENELDGVSFWNNLIEGKQKHRDYIYTWYNNNQVYTNKKELLRYIHNEKFKFYAPNKDFPEGRFFDLRTDPLELKGDYYNKGRFGLRFYKGINLDELTPEQKKGYMHLKNEIKKYDFKGVCKLRIQNKTKSFSVGESHQLTHKIYPKNATRTNILWHSDNSEIATIDKFGVLKAHKKGKVTISIYSWDDAYPLSANEKTTFNKGGISDSFELTIN